MLDGIKVYTETMKELKDLGIDVYVATLTPEG